MTERDADTGGDPVADRPGAGAPAGDGSDTPAVTAGRVTRLDETTVARIAAGEVVTRPVDAVVELVENALDAGATEIEVAVERGGIDTIRVADNGHGMAREDAVRAVERHTTSKIDAAPDVDRVRTLGFRGEALPAIAAAGRLTLTTRRATDAAATRIVVDGAPPPDDPGGTECHVETTGRGRGTTATVTDLFERLPARRAALATPAREFRRISAALTRYALVRPRVRFRLEHDGRTVLSAPGSGDPVDAVLAAYDREVAGRTHAVEHTSRIDGDGVGADDGAVRVTGVAVAPAITRASTAGLHLAVDGRALLDGDDTLRQAVLAGYDRLLAGDRYPVVALRIRLPPGHVDVNVHPRKRRLRFVAPDAVATAVETALRETFTAADVDLARVASDLGDDGDAFAPARSRFDDLTVIGQYRELYLLCEADGALLVVDQHAAHERVTFERLRAQLCEDDVASVAVDPPATLSLSAPQRAALAANEATITALGFAVEQFGGATYRVTAVPAPFGRADVGADALADVLDGLVAAGDDDENVGAGSHRGVRGHEREREYADPREALLATAACHPSLKAGDDLAPAAARDLIAALGDCEQPYSCPHGRPTILRVEEATLARGFDRPNTRLD